MILGQLICVIICAVGVGSARATQYFESPLGLYVGDGNFLQLLRGHAGGEMIGILFTNANCRDCYHYEEELQQIIQKLWSEYRVAVYRCELSGSSTYLQEEFAVKRFPLLHFVVFREGSYQLYLNYDMVLLSSLRKLVVKLQHYLQGATAGAESVKGESILIDMQEMGQIQSKEIIEEYGFNFQFYTLPPIYLLNTSVLEDTLEQEWKGLSRTGCNVYFLIVKRCLPISSAEELRHVLSVSVFDRTVEFTESSYRFYEGLNLDRHIFVAVLDSIFDRQASRGHLQMLDRVLSSTRFRNKITIFWMQVQINKRKLEHLGFSLTDRPPLFAQFSLSPTSNTILKEQKGTLFSQEAIVRFISKVLRLDEREQVRRWNKELLSESLRRLRLSKGYDILQSSQEVKRYGVAAGLFMPEVQLQLLGESDVFFNMVLNFAYFIERMRRFYLQEQISAYFVFDQGGCEPRGYGLFLYVNGSCTQLSRQIIFSNQQVEIHNAVQFEKLGLPKQFSVNEEEYEQTIEGDRNYVYFDYVDINM